MAKKNNQIIVVLLATISVVLAALIGVIALKGDGHMKHNGHDMNSHMSGKANSSPLSLTGADIMFLQMMIPHHQQAVDISNLALKSSTNAELLALAKTIITGQSAEINQMKMWLNQAGASEDMGHAMHDMGGMLDAAELSALDKASGKDFDNLWLKGMIGHHDGAIHMTQMIEDASNSEIKTFGEAIVRDQTAQIIQMKKMLA